MNGVPYEILTGPVTVYIAPILTAFPAIDLVTPAGPWVKIGTSGNLNYTRDGVKVGLKVKSEKVRADGDLGARKIFFTEQDMSIEVTLMDLSPAQVALALNSNTVTTVPPGPGTAGYQWVGSSRGGSEPAQVALLVRGVSALAASLGLFSQWQVPIAVQTGEPDITYKRGTAADLKLMFEALVDQTASTEEERFGRYVVGDEIAGT
jgi:hypothetical protein